MLKMKGDDDEEPPEQNGCAVPRNLMSTVYIFIKSNYKIIMLAMILVCISIVCIAKYRTNKRLKESTIKMNTLLQMHRELSSQVVELQTKMDNVNNENDRRKIQNEIEKLQDDFSKSLINAIKDEDKY